MLSPAEPWSWTILLAALSLVLSTDSKVLKNMCSMNKMETEHVFRLEENAFCREKMMKKFLGFLTGLEDKTSWVGHLGTGFIHGPLGGRGMRILRSYLDNDFQSIQGFLWWHWLQGTVGAQFALKMLLLKVSIAIKESMGRVLTHLINEVICFAENLTKVFEGTVAMDYTPKGWTFPI